MTKFFPKNSPFRVLVALLVASLLGANAERVAYSASAKNDAKADTEIESKSDENTLPPLSINDLPRIPSPLIREATPTNPNLNSANASTKIPLAPNALDNSNANSGASANANFFVPQSLPSATEARLRDLLSATNLADAHVGVCVKALGTARDATEFPAQIYKGGAQPILFASDADKRFLPASNLKLFTAALALKSLGAEKKFSTRVMALAGAPQLSGAISSTRNNVGTSGAGASGTGTSNADAVLYLVGGGDPSLGLDDLAQMARDVRKSGVTRVSGIVADTSLFQAETLGGRYPDGWTLDDAIWYYGAEVSALALERNQVDITITGTKKGRAARVEVSPQLPGFALGTDIVAQVQTGDRELKNLGESDLIQFERGDANSALGTKLVVRGQIAPGQVITDGVAIPNVARQTALAFAAQLQAAGIQVTGSADAGILPDAPVKTLAQHDSAPLRVLIQRFLKKSDNLYGEMLLRDVGAFTSLNFKAKSGNTSDESSGVGIASSGVAARAHGVLLDWLQSNKIASGGLRFSDGSGLSRYNLLTPRAVVSLLGAAEKLNGSRAFYDALPIAGTDGTLKNRMAKTRAADNVRAKTGTFSIASCLSGYVTTRDGQRLAVSILINFARNGDDARQLQNDIFVALAEANWTR